jgi:hypothetical protein
MLKSLLSQHPKRVLVCMKDSQKELWFLHIIYKGEILVTAGKWLSELWDFHLQILYTQHKELIIL